VRYTYSGSAAYLPFLKETVNSFVSPSERCVSWQRSLREFFLGRTHRRQDVTHSSSLSLLKQSTIKGIKDT
jgi:hypothetical protein